MSEQDYAHSVQSAEMLELTRRFMLRNEDARRWLQWCGFEDKKQAGTVADIAGGTGAITRWLLHAHPCLHATIVDRDESLIDYGHRMAIDEGLKSRLTLQVSDASALPLDDCSVDAAFIFGALHIMHNGREIIGELARIASNRVVIFWPVVTFRSPHFEEVTGPSWGEIRELRRALGLHGGELERSPVHGDLTMESVPSAMAESGLRNLRVRGLMITMDLEELSHAEYFAYRHDECSLLEYGARKAAGEIGGSADQQLDALISLYRSTRDELIHDHAAGVRRYLWDGGPVVAWIGEV